MSTAYIDESERSGSHGRRYILAATIPMSEDSCVEYRARMRSIKLPNRPKVHWYKAIHDHKMEIVEMIASFDVIHCVVVHDVQEGESSDRGRSKCIEMMAFQLETLDVDYAIFESRTHGLDNRDLKMLNYLRSSKSISSAFKGSHVAGADEPMLWIADAACGIVGESFEGNGSFRSLIANQLDVGL